MESNIENITRDQEMYVFVTYGEFLQANIEDFLQANIEDFGLREVNADINKFCTFLMEKTFPNFEDLYTIYDSDFSHFPDKKRGIKFLI